MVGTRSAGKLFVLSHAYVRRNNSGAKNETGTGPDKQKDRGKSLGRRRSNWSTETLRARVGRAFRQRSSTRKNRTSKVADRKTTAELGHRLGDGEHNSLLFVMMEYLPSSWKPLCDCLADVPRAAIWPLISKIAETGRPRSSVSPSLPFTNFAGIQN